MLFPWETFELLNRKQLAATEKNYGLNHPKVAATEKNYGLNHPKVATDLVELGAVLAAERRFAEAESLFRRALQIDEQSNPDQAATARDLRKLADLLLVTNRLTEAEPLLRRQLTVDQKLYTHDHPEIARDLSKLAGLLQESNRLTESEPLMRRSLLVISKFAHQDSLENPLQIRDYENLLATINYRYERLLRKIGKSDAEVKAAFADVERSLSQSPQAASATRTFLRIWILFLVCEIALWAVSLILHNVRIANFSWGPLLVLATLLAKQDACALGVWQIIHLGMVTIFW